MKEERDSHQPKFTMQMTLPQFERLSPNDDGCRTYLANRRWPNGVTCPRCKKPDQVYALAMPWHWKCANPDCRKGNAYRFSLTAGTIFENTKVALRIWFKVLYMMVTSNKGVSALQVHRTFGFGSNSTAFYMCHRLRAAMRDPEFRQLMGIVEADETLIGGNDENRPKNKEEGRTRARLAKRPSSVRWHARAMRPLYLAEFQFRFNNRNEADMFGKGIAGC